MSRKTTLITTASLLLALAPGARATTFSGRCAGAGIVRTERPLTVVPGLNGMTFTSRGTCTGSLDGRDILDLPFSGRSGGSGGLLSCTGGTLSGTGTIRFRGGRRLEIRFDNFTVGADSAFLLRGARGGAGFGRHQLTPVQEDLKACLGAGLTSIANTISFSTMQPLRG